MKSSGKAQLSLTAWFIVILTACTQAPPVRVEAPTIELQATPTEASATCADVDANWGKDWPAVVTALEQIMTTGQSCGTESASSKKYAAHYNYGAVLEANDDREAAITQYQAALSLDPNRQEALNALVRLDGLPDPTPASCLSTSAPRPDPAPKATPDLTSFVTAANDHLLLDGEVLKIKGINYYPRQAPWHRFLEEADPVEMAAELDLISQAGFNTLRVFLWYDALFTCEPETAIPNEALFAKVDGLLQMAEERNLKLIVTLNDLPDLRFRPLYTDWEHYDAQTVYIVRRYRNEPGILAWDLRNEGDIDYGAQSSEHELFSQDEVIKWLQHISQVVRENDPNHLITAGWWGDPLVTGPYVDFLSFHQFDEFNPRKIKMRIEAYKRQSTQPLVLQEVGYHSWAEAAEDQRDEITQAEILGNVIEAVEATDISGWVIWTGFDFEVPRGQPAHYEHFFGLWRTDLTPKPVLEALSLQ